MAKAHGLLWFCPTVMPPHGNVLRATADVFPESGFTIVLSEPRGTSAVFSQCCFVVARIVAAVKSGLKPLKQVKPFYPTAKAGGLYGLGLQSRMGAQCTLA